VSASADTQPEKVFDPTNAEAGYTDEEREWLLAVDRYKRESGRKFPTLCELLAVLRSLGYRKTAEAGELPRFVENRVWGLGSILGRRRRKGEG